MMIPCLCFLRMALTYIVPVRYCMNRGSANGAPAGGAFLVDIPSRWKPRTKQQPTGLLFATPAAWPCCSRPVPPTQKIPSHLTRDFCGGAFSTAGEPEGFIPDTAADSMNRATHGGLPHSLFHR